MDKTNSIVIGAATVTGAASGYAIGASKGASKIAKINEQIAQIGEPIVNAVKLKQTKDEYIQARFDESVMKFQQYKPSKLKKLYAKVREKAAQDYDKINFEEITKTLEKAAKDIKSAGNLRYKLAGVFGAIGLVIGAGIALINQKAS